MKDILAWRFALRAVVPALLLVGCGGGDDESAERPQQPPRERDERPARTVPEPAPAAEEPERPARSAGARVEVLAGGLEVPWDIAFLPDGRALVTERPGRVRLVSPRGRVRAAPVAEVDVSAVGEGGQLGLALDPDWRRGRRFAYLYVTTDSGSEIQRWRWREPGRLVPDGVVLDGIAAGPIHDAGRLRFGPDRRLYVPTGEAGQPELAQDRSSPNGKFLRLTPAQYRGRTDDPEVVSLGHRNPQGLDWQPGSGRLWASEHGPSGADGPSGNDEVNVIVSGRNYGWPEVTGTSHGSFAAPARVYEETIAPSGVAFLSSPGSPWTGDLFVAALAGRGLHRLEIEGERVTGDEELLDDRYGRLRAVVEAPDGSLWVTTSNRDGYGAEVSGDDDRILRLVPPRA